MDLVSLRMLPKVLLHDHLDGGLRPETLLELASERGYRRIPTDNPRRLLEWLRGRGDGSVERVLWAYGHMVAVMQTSSAIERVAREAAEDLTRENVLYAELRFAPTAHTTSGLSPDEAIEAAISGLRAGAGERGDMRLILVAQRQNSESDLVADLAVRYREHGIVGFDLAGIEQGHRNLDHLGAIRKARDGGVSITLHAGDELGIDSIIEAVEGCGATRVGVAHHMVDDVFVRPDGSIEVGARAASIRDAGTHLEMCPTAGLRMHNIAPEQHPVGLLHREGFKISLNTDSRLLYGGDVSSELDMVTRFHGFTLDDIQAVTVAAVDAAFCNAQTRLTLLARVKRAFAIA
jgi:adenosine deaminase